MKNFFKIVLNSIEYLFAKEKNEVYSEKPAFPITT